MEIKNKRQILTTIISVFVSVFLVAGFAYAVTTIGNDVSVGGNLTVGGEIVGYVPYTGATADVDLGENTLRIGAENTNGRIDGIAATTTDTSGGGLTIVSGDGLGIGGGGGFSLIAGQGGEMGDGGAFSMDAGNGGSSGGLGGSMNFFAGSAQGGDSDGGNIILSPGIASGSGKVGHVEITDQVSNLLIIFDTSLLTDSDKTFTFPDASGTFALEMNTIRKLATVENIDFKTLGHTLIYTVPTGYTLVVTDVVLRTKTYDTPNADGVGEVERGSDGIAIGDSFSSGELSPVGWFTHYTTVFSGWGSILTVPAGDTVGVEISVPDTGTALTSDVDLIGYLIED